VNQHLVLYDGDCPLCVFQMRLLTWLDWTGQLALRPISDPEARAAAPNVSREDLLEAIHVVTRDGRLFKAARGLRFVGMRLPLMIPLALLLWVPGVILVAEKIYLVISRNRLGLSRVFGCKDACAVMPKRDREQDRIA
jgi:predicted DCC family thiol-disulfide oxidoreductase YuxK